MLWFLRLFPQYRELERRLRAQADLTIALQDQNNLLTKQNVRLERRSREQADRAMAFQDQVDVLIKQNVRLEEEAAKAHGAETDAMKRMVNLYHSLQFGTIPPYREAYSLPERPQRNESGPVATNRVFARDHVRQAKEDFRQQLLAMDIIPEPPVEVEEEAS